MGPAFAYEAMECLGGNGYVEDGLAARIYRELPVNAIWEGSGNVMVHDALRVLQRQPECVDRVLAKLEAGVGGDARIAAQLEKVRAMFAEPQSLEQRGREFVEALAVLAAGCLLRSHAPAAVADAFIATRMGGHWRQTYGQGLETADVHAILARVPSVS